MPGTDGPVACAARDGWHYSTGGAADLVQHVFSASTFCTKKVNAGRERASDSVQWLDRRARADRSIARITDFGYAERNCVLEVSDNEAAITSYEVARASFARSRGVISVHSFRQAYDIGGAVGRLFWLLRCPPSRPSRPW